MNLYLKKKYVKKNCAIAMPSEKDNIWYFNQYMKSYKLPYIILANMESSNKE